jgi:signal transduction histidine kinase
LCWGALFYFATWLGTLTLIPNGLLALASPAAGVASLWFVFGNPRTWRWDVPVLVLCVVVNNLRLDVPGLLLVVTPLVTLLQVTSFVVALRALAPGMREEDGIVGTLRTLRDFAGFLTAAAISATVFAVGTNLAQAAAGLSTGDPRYLLIRWGRTTSTVVVIGAVGLIVGPPLYRAMRRHELVDVLRQRLEDWNAVRLLEGLALTVSSVVLYTLCFRFASGYAVAFLLFVATAWVGLRFSPGTIALHSLLTGTLAVSFTVAGDGVFGLLDDPTLGAALVQLFVLVTTCTGLVLGLSREALAAAERESTQHSHMLDSVLTEVDDGIVLMDESGTVLMINRAGMELLDLEGSPRSREGLTDGTVGSHGGLTHPDGTPLTQEDSPSRKALQGQEVRDQEIQVRDRDGAVRRILRTSARVLPPVGEDGGNRKVLVTYHDITADRMRREALAKFAGEVSHDLKNPLAVVSGWTDALLEEFESGPVAPELGASMARRVQSAATHMQDFIGNMLDYTVTRDQELSPLDLDLGVLASKVASLRIDSTADGEPPVITVEGHERVWADPLLVRVLLDNLIGNAVKYVGRGVRPRVEVRITAADADWVQVGITDNGIGITPEQRDRIFEAFARVEQEGYQGTGLGLAICQRIVQRHGGTITVDGATAGPGTVFAFTLPRTEAAYEESQRAQALGS